MVKFTTLINSYERMQDEQKTNLAKRDKLRVEQNKRVEEMKQLAAKLKQHTPESEAYRKTEEDLREKQAGFEAWGRVEQQKLIEEETRIIRGVYEEIERATAEFAKKNGYVVILKEDELDLAKAAGRELKLTLALRKILYVDPSVDVTAKVLALLNKKYKSQPR